MICNLPDEVKAKYDRSSIRIMIANAAPWSFALKQQYVRDFPPESLFEVYGSTELGVNTVLRPEDQMRKPGSCGKESPTGRDPPVRRRRQHRHRHRPRGHGRGVRPVAVGVRRLLQAARQVRRGPSRRLPDRRRHRLPRRRGLPLHLRPQEGHDHLGRDEHLPGRDRVGARGPPRHLRSSGVRHPERRLGRTRPRGRSSSVPASDLDEGGVSTYARAHLASYKVPRSISWIDELPKTGSGKILKRELRAPFWAGRATNV